MTIIEINKKAEEIAEKYNSNSLSPFPYETITSDKKDLHIFLTDKLNEKISGAIIFDEGAFTILINKTKPQTRQNFTIAHELGHYFLHQEELKNEHKGILIDEEYSLDGTTNILLREDQPITRTRIEIEANNFAASLLMPEKVVRRVWESIKDIRECASIFNVSISAMSIRLERLGLA